MKRLGRLVPAMVAIAILCFAPLAQAQVLKQVPSDALVVIKFNKLKATSDKIAALATKLGVAQFQPKMTDPLGSLQAELGLKDGVDVNGDAAIAILNGDLEGKEPPVLMLVPVTDYKAFVAGIKGAKTEGDVTTFTMANDTTDVNHMVNWGSFAAISPSKAVLAKKPDGILAPALATKEMESRDIVAYGNMKIARAKILPKIAEGRAKFIAEMEKNMARQGAGAARPRRPGAPAEAPAAPAANQKYTPLVRAFVNRVIDVAEQLVRDTDAATYGVSLNDAGINVACTAEFAKESPTAARIATSKNTDSSLLSGLPESKYIFFGGTKGDSKAGEKLIADFLAPIEKEFTALGDDGKKLQAYADGLKQYVGSVSAMTMGMLTPSGMLGQDAIFQVISVNHGDAKGIVESQRKMIDSQQAIMDLMTAGNAQMPRITTAFKAGAKTVDGVEFNQITTTFGQTEPGKPVSPQQAQMQQMMTFLYGPGGPSALIGSIGADKVITSMGASEEALTKFVAAAKANQDALAKSKSIQATASQLPPNRSMAFYFAIDQFATTIANYAKAFGMPVNFQLPPDLAPLGMTMGVEANSVRADGHIPTQTLQSVIAAGMQTYMQMQGGQQPGGPGGL